MKVQKMQHENENAINVQYENAKANMKMYDYGIWKCILQLKMQQAIYKWKKRKCTM